MEKKRNLDELKAILKRWYHMGGYIYCLGMLNAWGIAEVINWKEALELDCYLSELHEEVNKK